MENKEPALKLIEDHGKLFLDFIKDQNIRFENISAEIIKLWERQNESNSLNQKSEVCRMVKKWLSNHYTATSNRFGGANASLKLEDDKKKPKWLGKGSGDFFEEIIFVIAKSYLHFFKLESQYILEHEKRLFLPDDTKKNNMKRYDICIHDLKTCEKCPDKKNKYKECLHDEAHCRDLVIETKACLELSALKNCEHDFSTIYNSKFKKRTYLCLGGAIYGKKGGLRDYLNNINEKMKINAKWAFFLPEDNENVGNLQTDKYGFGNFCDFLDQIANFFINKS
jgi:hypothetical protein